MPKKLNLIGQRFGRLVVIDFAPNKNNKTQWKCQCDCGNEYIGFTDSLRQGKLRSCGCLRTETAHKNGLAQLVDLTGQRFGKLTVIKYNGSQRKRSSWLCQCDCGNQVIVNQQELQVGDTISCGCVRSSFGEKQIEQILQDKNLNYQKEFSFSDLKSEKNVPLRFDFAVFNNNQELLFLIEYDGEQHFSHKSEKIWHDTLEAHQKRDQLKNNYCIQHNYKLYRIPYWEKLNLTYDLITSEKYLINPITVLQKD